MKYSIIFIIGLLTVASLYSMGSMVPIPQYVLIADTCGGYLFFELTLLQALNSPHLTRDLTQAIQSNNGILKLTAGIHINSFKFIIDCTQIIRNSVRQELTLEYLKSFMHEIYQYIKHHEQLGVPLSFLIEHHLVAPAKLCIIYDFSEMLSVFCNVLRIVITLNNWQYQFFPLFGSLLSLEEYELLTKLTFNH